jgi:hypothetical protein
MSTQPQNPATSKPSAYPGSIAVFSEKIDHRDVVFAEHINSLQAEVVALQRFLGVMSDYPPSLQSSTFGQYLAALKASLDEVTATATGVKTSLEAFERTVSSTYLTKDDGVTKDAMNGAIKTALAGLDWNTDIQEALSKFKIDYIVPLYHWKTKVDGFLETLFDFRDFLLTPTEFTKALSQLPGNFKTLSENFDKLSKDYDKHKNSTHDGDAEVRYKRIVFTTKAAHDKGWTFERTLRFRKTFERPGVALALAQTYGYNADAFHVWVKEFKDRESFTIKARALEDIPKGREIHVLVVGVANSDPLNPERNDVD